MFYVPGCLGIYMRVRFDLLLVGLFLAFGSASAQAAHTQARLVLAAETARAGDEILAGIHLKNDPGWDTCSRNSGQSGLPTTIKWELPSGISAGEILWPVPRKISEEGA